MSRPLLHSLSMLAAAGCVAVALGWLQAQDEVPPPPGPENTQGYDLLTSGPVHEAFADPYNTDPVAGVVIPDQPPQPIDEVPPEVIPEGNNVIWIPGYWGWDPQQEDFVWISGVWRDVPPGRRWVPGYWAQIEGGWQWVTGFWTTAESQELAYLPYPPESLEQGPSAPPPDGDYFWVPGCWVWVEADYRWRPGYWAPAQENWVWVPDHYTWTPYGCLFVEGFWDYSLPQRGVLFTPVYFTEPVYTRPAFRYTPLVTVNTSRLLIHLFVSPRYHHYYFGDYYAVRSPQIDLLPWYAYETRRGGYDPLLTYYQWSYARRNINFVQRIQVWNQYFIENEQIRPPRTFRAQQQLAARIQNQTNINQTNVNTTINQIVLAESLRDAVNSERGRRQFRRLAEPQQQQLAQAAQQFRRIEQQRMQTEVAQAAAEPGPDGRGERDDRRGQRRERRLELPQTVTALRPESPAAQPTPDAPETPDAANPPDRTPGADQPGRGPRVPPPARPPVGGDALPRPGTDPSGPNFPPGREPRDGDEPRPGTLPQPGTAPGQDRPPTDVPRRGRDPRDGEQPRRPERGPERPGLPGAQSGGDPRRLPPGVAPGADTPRPEIGRDDANRGRERRGGDGQPGRPDARPNVPNFPGAVPGQADPRNDARRGQDRRLPPGLTPGGRLPQPGLAPDDRDRSGRPDLDGRDPRGQGNHQPPQIPRFGFRRPPDGQTPGAERPRGNDPLQFLPPGREPRDAGRGEGAGRPPGLAPGGFPGQVPGAERRPRGRERGPARPEQPNPGLGGPPQGGQPGPGPATVPPPRGPEGGPPAGEPPRGEDRGRGKRDKDK